MDAIYVCSVVDGGAVKGFIDWVCEGLMDSVCVDVMEKEIFQFA